MPGLALSANCLIFKGLSFSLKLRLLLQVFTYFLQELVIPITRVYRPWILIN